MSLSSSSILLLSILFYFPTSNSIPPLPPPPPLSFSTPLIHRNSPESPVYDPNLTLADLSRLTARAAKARIRARKEAAGLDAYTAPVIPRGAFAAHYFMKYKIGNPPMETYGIPDTGSELIWLQCLPCTRCYKQSIPYFDPAKSSTYNKVLCTDNACNLPGTDLECHPGNNICSYDISYEDGAMTSGDVATETLTLGDDITGGVVTLTNMVIGCGHNNKEHHEEISPDLPPGLIGLSRDPLSLVSQLGFNEFSHCIATTKDASSGHSLMKIGEGSVITGTGTQTPLYSAPTGWYFVNITGIQVGDTKLNIPPEVFKMNSQGTTGTIIDTGTTFFELARAAFDPLVAEIQRQMRQAGYNPVVNPDFDLCYADVEFAPKIVILFEGLDFELSLANTWDQVAPAQFCLTILGGSDIYMSIFGMYLMRDVNVGYDLAKNVVSLAYTACPLIK